MGYKSVPLPPRPHTQVVLRSQVPGGESASFVRRRRLEHPVGLVGLGMGRGGGRLRNSADNGVRCSGRSDGRAKDLAKRRGGSTYQPRRGGAAASLLQALCRLPKGCMAGYAASVLSRSRWSWGLTTGYTCAHSSLRPQFLCVATATRSDTQYPNAPF